MDFKDKKRCLKRLFSLKKSEAKKRKKSFSLDLNQLSLLVTAPCHYCGSVQSNLLKYQGLEFGYNGIDRLDNSVGYEPKNCVAACRFCNSLRASMPLEAWLEFLDSVAESAGGYRKFNTIRSLSRPKLSFYGKR